MSVLVMAACLAAGGAIGFLGGVLGIGGGLIAIPALGLLLGMSQQLAQGTALIMVLPTIVMAVRKYNQHVRLDRRVAIAGAAGAVFSTWVGARLALDIPSRTLRLGFAVFLFCIALFYLYKTLRKPAPSGGARPFTPPAAVVLGVVCGMLGGFFGVGGAVLAVPLLTTMFRLPQTSAQALALSMVIPGSTIALITYGWAGETDWRIGLPLAVGSLLFVPVGVRLAYRLPEKRLRAIFAAMLMVTVLLLIFEA
ncbi:sulfite exporter TauE/SafE family protein [Bordetella avium]|uniref:sulfite exporter TauE/SafE family protein n=1 Tax=Bordetella avium TaxID=521 RepID=UPI000579DB29|nr:sulfite exporter TauE/SafE family protein [Bordetella avium]RIQ51138.1 sulfite exporter TauE/SafE family protein [Bordetella avium]RIQ68953.1 sulfite exporter TauE/SafE family protein [Bordetella avium]